MDTTRNRVPATGGLPVAPENRGGNEANARPVIPFNVLDAPVQRAYAFAIYIVLWGWKLWDWARVLDDEADSLGLFLKWLAIDLIFLFGLPELHIPWLEWPQPVVISGFAVHAALDFMLMFNLGLPWHAWLAAVLKLFYDREVAISENTVKVSSIQHNASLIMGRQIINILPEGSAVLNPDGVSLCIGGKRETALLPIYFNATLPVEVELVRIDLESNEPEIVKLSKAQTRQIRKQADSQSEDAPETVKFELAVKKSGAYYLSKVLDEYKLEVQQKPTLTFVPPCPDAQIMAPPSAGRCLGDLSDTRLEVTGTPPLTVSYSRTINGKDHSVHLQSLQPDGFSAPLLSTSRTLTGAENGQENVSRVRPQRVTISLNESMQTSGDWQYSVIEVQDALGNLVSYAAGTEDTDLKSMPRHLVQSFIVKERPRVRMDGCDVRNPLRVARGGSKELPIRFDLSGPTADETGHTLTWLFSPYDSLTDSGDHGDAILTGTHTAKNAFDRPRVTRAGLYTLRSITSNSCEGEIQEPASCMLLNPLEPKLEVRSEEIPDSCAGNMIGLRVDLDLVGTPPFIVRYDEIANGQRESKRVNVQGMRHQMELIPRIAGHHKYIFTHVGDSIYKSEKLSGPAYVLEQDVKPAASALIQYSTNKMSACLGEPISADILLLGEPPFTLEWEIIHDGKRRAEKAAGIHSDSYPIRTAPLNQGGEYTLALTSVHDKRGCRAFLKDELKISVRRQLPRAAFGAIESKRRIRSIEGSAVRLPIRLTGEGPWNVSYINSNEDSQNLTTVQRQIKNDNDFIQVFERGVFTLTHVRDRQCSGTIDPKASKFQVDWYPRPQLSIVPSSAITEDDGLHRVIGVCEGDASGFEVTLKGSPPYHVEYEVRHQPKHGSESKARKSVDAALGRTSIQMDTSKAGTYTYTFTSLTDNLYNDDPTSRHPVVRQQVSMKPTAAFAKAGQTFKYCMTEQRDEDKIPITLTGLPPFSVEVEIKHQSGLVPGVYRVAGIDSHAFELRVPREHLKLGIQQVRLRNVRDASGCRSVVETGGQSVQIQLFDAPGIYPLETRNDYCVGEFLNYVLSGTPPFEIWYTFRDEQKKAKTSTTSFRRIAERPGHFTITTIADKVSECRAPVNITKQIHPMPSVKLSQGKSVKVDIHEGSEVDMTFDFSGTPPFEFTYTRSTNARKGQKSHVLESRTDVSYEHSKTIRSSQEGTYEVISIRDMYCSFPTQPHDRQEPAQKVLSYP